MARNGRKTAICWSQISLYVTIFEAPYLDRLQASLKILESTCGTLVGIGWKSTIGVRLLFKFLMASPIGPLGAVHLTLPSYFSNKCLKKMQMQDSKS